MKLNKKKILAVALVVCLLAVISMGTLAWFTDTKNVTNKFLVAGSDDQDPNEIFSVKVWEETPEGTDDVDGHTYENILPGDTLKKNVFVENTGSYNQYIRLTVTISDAQAWINALGADFNISEVFVGFDTNQWNHIWNSMLENPAAQELTYVMYYNAQLEPGQKINVFTDIQIPTSLTQAQAAAFAGGFEIDVQAEAIQTENVVPEGTPVGEEAFEAFAFVAANS